MAFERVLSGGQAAANASAPSLSFYPSGRLRFNKAAVETFFDGVSGVEFFVDDETDRLGVALSAGGDNGHSLNENGTGMTVSARAVFHEIGVDWENLPRSVGVELDHDPDEGLLVCDLAPVREAVDDD